MIRLNWLKLACRMKNNNALRTFMPFSKTCSNYLLKAETMRSVSRKMNKLSGRKCSGRFWRCPSTPKPVRRWDKRKRQAKDKRPKPPRRITLFPFSESFPSPLMSLFKKKPPFPFRMKLFAV